MSGMCPSVDESTIGHICPQVYRSNNSNGNSVSKCGIGHICPHSADESLFIINNVSICVRGHIWTHLDTFVHKSKQFFRYVLLVCPELRTDTFVHKVVITSLTRIVGMCHEVRMDTFVHIASTAAPLCCNPK